MIVLVVGNDLLNEREWEAVAQRTGKVRERTKKKESGKIAYVSSGVNIQGVQILCV
jgi:hypothetical protein